MSRRTQILEMLKSKTSLQRILSDAARNVGEELVGKTFSFRRFSNNDDHATIRSHDESEVISEFDWKGFAEVSDEDFILPFVATVPVRIDFYIAKEDFYIFEEDEDRPSVSDHNDQVFEAEYETEVEVHSSLTIFVPSDVALDQPDMIDEDSVKIGSIKKIEDANSEE